MGLGKVTSSVAQFYDEKVYLGPCFTEAKDIFKAGGHPQKQTQWKEPRASAVCVDLASADLASADLASSDRGTNKT